MDQVGNCWEFTGNPRSPLGVLGVHWESTGNRGRVETIANNPSLCDIHPGGGVCMCLLMINIADKM